ncbi:MAG TPA: hypothetical protein VMR25_06485, partial [Planctomycetaceae bacterium]|nr:hypothetical protein [Planctomycetaceae bacterium]
RVICTQPLQGLQIGTQHLVTVDAVHQPGQDYRQVSTRGKALGAGVSPIRQELFQASSRINVSLDNLC